ncbi:MAG: metal ABC transporter permease [Methylibium sp.]|nr:metal ABC transporter permease [Methylibium sp.]MBA3625416.1 metal ABC transporter permease [Methylibium sp.]
MELLHELFIAPLRDFGFMRDGLIVVVLIGLTASVLSCLLVVRRQALMGDAIAHSVLLGVAVGWLVAREAGVLAGAMLAGVLSGIAMTFIERSGIKLDSAMGVVFTASFALGLAIISVVKPTGIDLFHVLLGNVLGVTEEDVLRTAVGCSLVLGAVLLLFRGLQFWSFDPVAAQVAGLPTATLHYVFTAMLSATIVVSIQAVGILLVIAMLITPGATALLLVKRLAPMMVVAASIGVASGVGGLYGSYYLDVASGPAIVLVASALFLATLLLAPRRGVLWRHWSQRRSRLSALDDDLLKDALLAEHEEGLAVDPALLASRLGLMPAQVAQALARLAGTGMAGMQGPRVALTEAGEKRATELVRTQRLLERYLHDVERMPLDHIRSEADRREHEMSAAAVEDMAKLLGHPTTDPHGHPIPQPAEEGLRRIAGQSLATTLPGHGGRVSMISDDRADLLVEMVRLGILPQAGITVVSCSTEGVQVRINDGAATQISPDIAFRVFVMPRLQAVAETERARSAA